MLNKKRNEYLEQEKPLPVYLREDYPYKAIGEAVTDMGGLESTEIYEIKCYACGMSIRSQGKNVKSAYERLQASGCIGCGNKRLVVNRINMSKNQNFNS